MKALIIAVAGAAVIALTGATAQASVSRSSHAQGVRAAALLASVKVSATEFKFILSKKTARRGVVTFRVTNIGKVSHDVEISGRKTRLLSHGQSATLRVTFLRKGAYPYKCTVPGHAAAGMKGVFTIT